MSYNPVMSYKVIKHPLVENPRWFTEFSFLLYIRGFKKPRGTDVRLQRS